MAKEKGDIMKRLLMATALAGALATPAMAADTAIIMLTDGIRTRSPRPAREVDLGPQNLDGVNVTLTFGSKGMNPNELNEANILISNTTGTTQTLSIILGANGYRRSVR